jgi:hypothetical protein
LPSLEFTPRSAVRRVDDPVDVDLSDDALPA